MRSWHLRNMLNCVGNERHDNIPKVIPVVWRYIYIIFNLDVPDDIKSDISHMKSQHILYVFSFKFSMCDTFMFDELLHDTFTLFIDNVLFSIL
jgi:hypothetical protein